MRHLQKIILLCCCFHFVVSSFAQYEKVKFGDIKTNDFTPKAYSIDSNANAVVLFDIGSAVYEGDSYGGFSILTNRHMRIRILNRNAFDFATLSIPLYISSDYEEKVENLEAVTYNMENGKVVSYKLDKSSIFKEKVSKSFTLEKFTMPNLKEGCILEIKYRLVSPYEREMKTWYFQKKYPVLWSQFSASIPSIYDFVILRQGFQALKINKSDVTPTSYNLVQRGSAAERSQYITVTLDRKDYVWAIENIPALKHEDYITTTDNYVAKLDFVLSKILFPDSPVRDVMSNWYKISESLMKNENFGESLTKNNGWMDDEIQKIVPSKSTKLEAAQKIYAYVRDHFTCTNHNRTFLSDPLKKVFETKQGNVAEVNLLLIAMLAKYGLETNPVMLSTRDNGKAWEEYPMLDKMNYVIAQVMIDDKDYLLDASHSKMGFGHLPIDCYNGFARIINKDKPLLIDLSSDSIRESKITTMFISNGEKGSMTGSYTSYMGEFESQDLRDKLVKTSKEDFFKDIKKGFSIDVNLSNTAIDSLKNFEQPVAVKYDFTMEMNDDMLYINPIFGEAYKENIFKAEERYYPVEMPYAINENFILRMEIPVGYAIEEVPKSARVNFNENEGLFEYMVAKDEAVIQLRSTVKLNKATFDAEDYESLREFFGYIVKKQSEQIVLKKIKK